MKQKKIIGTGNNRGLKELLFTLISTVVIVIVLRYFGLINSSKPINVTLIPLSILGILLLPFLLKFLDKKPLIIIDAKSIWMRKSGLPFVGLVQIPWDDIAEYRVHEYRTKYGDANFVEVKRKSNGKRYSLNLNSIKTKGGDVMNALRKNLPYGLETGKPAEGSDEINISSNGF